jgi:hypothetical protein
MPPPRTLLCALCTLCLAHEALACTPSPPGYHNVEALSELPALPPDKVRVPLLISSSAFPLNSQVIARHEATDREGHVFSGTSELLELGCRSNRSYGTTTCTSFLLWIPDVALPDGDYTLHTELTQSSSDPLRIEKTFRVDATTSLAALTPPQLSAELMLLPEAGEARTCCTLSARSPGI